MNDLAIAHAQGSARALLNRTSRRILGIRGKQVQAEAPYLTPGRRNAPCPACASRVPLKQRDHAFVYKVKHCIAHNPGSAIGKEYFGLDPIQ